MRSPYQISSSSVDEQANALYSALEAEIYNALVDEIDASEDILKDVYVASRLTSSNTENIHGLLSSLPDDIVELYQRKEPNGSPLGFFELDIINFLFNIKVNKLLCILGHIGIGKSSYLNYIFRYVQSECPSMGRFFPVIFDFLKCPSRDPSYYDILFVFYGSLKKKVAPLLDEDKRNDFLYELEVFLERARSRTVGAQASEVVQLSSLLKKFVKDKEIVLVLDNIDQLTPHGVEKISHLARSILIEVGATVIVSMRPPTFATHLEADSHRGAFYTFRIELTPPDLRQVISRRMRRIFGGSSGELRISDKRTGFGIRISDKQKAIESLLENVLSAENQRVLQSGICNNCTRKALAAFAYFLKYRDLPLESLFNIKTQSQPEEYTHSNSTKSLLKGLFLGAQRYYRSDVSPVPNIFVLDLPGHSPNYSILYHTLSLLKWSSGMTSKDRLYRWLSAFSFSDEIIFGALKFLLKRQLIFSPEDEFNVTRAQHFKITVAGNFFITEFIENEDYLYQAVFDIPLQHTGWAGPGKNEYRARIYSIIELIDLVIKTERTASERVSESSSVIPNFGAIQLNGFLSRRLINASQKIVASGALSKHHSVEEASREFRLIVGGYTEEIAEAENVLERALPTYVEIQSSESTRITKNWRVGSNGSFIVDRPESLMPTLKNSVKITLNLKLSDLFDSVFAILEEFDGKNTRSAISLLEGNEKRNSFSGELILDDVDQARLFPKVRLSIFADSCPILSKEI